MRSFNGKERRGLLSVSALTAALLLSTAACSSPEERLEKYTKSGHEFLEGGDVGKANVQFQNALKINEDHVPALEGVAEIAEQKRDFGNLFGVLQKIVRLDPNNADAQTKLGKLYLVSGDETAALEAADRSLAINAEDSEAIALKAAVLLKLEDTAQAVELARKALAIDATNAEAVAVVAAERARAGDNDGALAEVEAALKLERDIPVLHLLRLQLLSNLQRNDDLLKAHLEAIEVYPDQIPYRQLYIRTLIGGGDLAAAKTQFEEIARLSPGDVDAMLDVVRMERRLNGAEAAGAAFLKYVEANPDNVDLKFNYAAYLRSEKDLVGAEAIYKEFAAAKNDATLVHRARNEIAAVRLLEGKVDEALAIIEDILKADGRNTDALMKRAGIKIDAGEYDSAILDLRTAIEDAPNSTPAKILMGVALERKGDMDFAKSQMAQAVEESNKDPRASNVFAKLLMRTGEADRAERTLIETLAAHPRDLENLKLLAAVRLMRQDWRGAEEAAKQIEALSQEDPVVNRILGAAYTGLKDFSGAIDVLSEENDREPLSGRPLAALVSAYVQDGRAEEAKTMLRSMIETSPDNFVARILLAQTLFSQQDLAGAEETLVAAVDRAPERADTVESLYRLLSGAGRREEAAAMLDRVIASAPENIGARVLKADYLLLNGGQEEAMQIYADILVSRPGDLLAANNYASLLSDLRDDPQSRARAVEVAKVLEGHENPFFLDTLGWAQVRNGDVAAGIANLEKAVAGSTGFADAHFHLGAAYIQAGEFEKGRAELEKAAEVGGESPIGAKARAMLAAN